MALSEHGPRGGRQCQTLVEPRVAHTCRFWACVRSREPVQGKDGGVLEEKEAKAGPRPQVRRGDQSALDRVIVHVIQFLPAFLLTPDVQVIEAPLPEAMGAVEVHGGGQGQSAQHFGTPRLLTMCCEAGE